MSATATINIRIDAALKKSGDAVLKENGISTTTAIKMLWEELSQTHELPEFVLRKQKDSLEEEKRRKLEALKRLGRTSSVASERREPLPSYKELRDQMYDEMYKEYLELK